jgi:hypothetical protein
MYKVGIPEVGIPMQQLFLTAFASRTVQRAGAGSAILYMLLKRKIKTMSNWSLKCMPKTVPKA